MRRASHPEIFHIEPPLPEPAAPPAERIAELLRERKFCAAARLYAELTGDNVVDSKLAIDRLARKHGYLPISGCASHFALLIGLLGLGGWAVIHAAAGLF